MKHNLTIREFSEISGVEVTTLRYWDEIGIFSPMHRNPETNYRYYTLPQVLALNFVTALSDLNVPLKTIGELRRNRSPDKLMKLIRSQEKIIDSEMRDLQKRFSIMHTRRELIDYGMRADVDQIKILWREDKAMVMWPQNEYEEGDTFLEPFANYVKQAPELHIDLSYPVGGYFESMESFQEDPERPLSFFTVDPSGTHTRKAGEYLIGFVRGDYGKIGDLADRMAAHAAKKALKIAGPVYLFYLHDEFCTHEPSEYLAEACVAVVRE
ncbi:MAG: MerR family transcriptional regulator [Clostridiales bacterium]|nr:MerR family transcriptional regulator [Clostridiales bacterium]